MPSVRLFSVDPSDGWNHPAAVPSYMLVCDPTGLVSLTVAGVVRRQWTEPLQALSWMRKSLSGPGTRPGTRWIGYLSYDCGLWFEPLPPRAVDDLQLPLFAFALVDGFSDAPVSTAGVADVRTIVPPVSTFDRAGYEAAVGRVIGYVRAGDIFQLNLSQRLRVPSIYPPAVLFDRLVAEAPSRYSAHLDFDHFSLVSHSPELFLRVTPDRRVVTRPIKGTRPRLPGMDVELRDSVKDAAELNMIVDLERNDLGRVCEPGSVRVSQRRTIETHPSVFHGVAAVEGVLRKDVDFVDLLRATFPGGSITGAPKIRAMQIIDELEPVRRGPYCGAIGYLAADGTIEFNVAIRTMTVTGGRVYVPVGGGIVADSDPAAEYAETMVKAGPMLRAAGVG